MIVFLKSDGSVAYRSYENINLGSNKANKLTVIAPFAPSSVMTVYITLPNGETSDPLFMANSGKAIKELEDYSVEGKNLSVWETEIESYITGISGILKIQLYINNDGTTFTSSLVTIEVNVGVKNVPTPPPTEGAIYEQIIDYLSDSMNYVEGGKQEAEAAATEAKTSKTEAQKWATGSYVDENGKTQNVTSEDAQFDNNAKYYASEASESEASAIEAKEAAETAKEAAETAAANAAESATNARTSASAAENYLTELKSGIVEPLKKRVDNIDYILEQFGAVVEERDSSSALVKSVPARSDFYAYLSEIGGRTERFNQRLILPTFNNPSFGGISTYFWQLAEGGSGTDSEEVSAVTKGGITMINNGDGSFTFRGTATTQVTFNLFSIALSTLDGYVENIPILGIDNTINRYLSFGGVSLPAGVSVGVQRNNEYDEGGGEDVITGSGGTTTGSTVYKYIDKITLKVPSGTVFNNLTIKLMLNDGTSAMPWQSPNEPFEGLRSAKVKAIKSYGENLFNSYNITDNSGYTTVVNQTTFAVTNYNVRYNIRSPKAGRYYFSAKSNRTGTYGGGVVIATYDNAGSMVTAFFWYPDVLNPKYEFTLNGNEYELRVILYGSNKSDGNIAIYKDVKLLLNTPTLTPTVSEIPVSIQSLPNYGEGNPNDPTEYNYVDGENGVYIRKGGIVGDSWISETPTTTPINFDPLIPVEASGSIEVVTDNNQEVPTTFVYNIIQEA